MSNKLVERIVKLLDVKTIITFGIIGTVIYLAVRGTIDSQNMVLFAGIVMTYFFTKDNNKTAQDTEKPLELIL